MKIGILSNMDKIGTEKTREEMRRFLERAGHDTLFFSTHTEVKGVDVVIVLGGDGAILHAAVVAAQKGIKIIGINYGTLGFLTEYERNEWEDVKDLLSALGRGSCKIVKRSLLEVTVGGKSYYALNEIAVQRDNHPTAMSNSQILKVEFSANEGRELIAGDGVLICTPTGSTAYSLSAGGAILTPEVPVFMMTPICAFSMRARPIVFSNADEFQVKIAKGRANVLADGNVFVALSEGEELHVKKAPFTADFPVKDDVDFFERVRNKLNG